MPVVMLLLGGLTLAGARRRGTRLLLATLATIGFPLAWTIRYLHDQLPHRRSGDGHGS